MDLLGVLIPEVAQTLQPLNPSLLKVAVFLKSNEVGTSSHPSLAFCKVINKTLPPQPQHVVRKLQTDVGRRRLGHEKGFICP